MSIADNAYGYDVSHWQSTTPALDKVHFLFARASIGTARDERYGQHILAAQGAGKLTGAYHFGDNRTPAADQAKTFIAAAGDVDFYVLDHEGANQMTDSEATKFVSIVKDAKGHCGLYASLSGFPSFGQSWNWIALWASTPPASRSWAFWQFGGSGIDQDVYNGTPAQLRAFAASLKGTPPVRTFSFTSAATVGSVRLASIGHSYLRLLDNTLHGPIDPATFGSHAAFGPVTLVGGGISGPADVRTVGYIVGAEAAFLLKEDVIFTPTTLSDTALDAANAKITDLSKQVTTLQTTASTAAAKEKERIALAEAARIRGL